MLREFFNLNTEPSGYIENTDLKKAARECFLPLQNLAYADRLLLFVARDKKSIVVFIRNENDFSARHAFAADKKTRYDIQKIGDLLTSKNCKKIADISEYFRIREYVLLGEPELHNAVAEVRTACKSMRGKKWLGCDLGQQADAYFVDLLNDHMGMEIGVKTFGATREKVDAPKLFHPKPLRVDSKYTHDLVHLTA